MHPPKARLSKAPLERGMNGRAVIRRSRPRYRRGAACYGLRPRKIPCLTPCERPTFLPRALESELERPEPDREGLILDPRDGDAEDDASSPKQKSLLAIAGSLLAEISLTKLLLAWVASIVLPAAILGLAPLIATAWVGGVFSRFLELYGIGAALVLLAVAGVGWIGWRPLFRVGGSEFLGAQRAGRSARIRLVPRGDPASGRASLQAKGRGGARAHAGDELRRRRNSSRGDRGAGRDHRLAGDAVDRIGLGSRRAASPDLADARQRRRHHVGLPRGGLARLGLRRRQHGPAARPRSVRRRAARAGASGGWRISPTSISSASVMASGSRAGGAGRAATSG